jgi:hypothetical protein
MKPLHERIDGARESNPPNTESKEKQTDGSKVDDGCLKVPWIFTVSDNDRFTSLRPFEPASPYDMSHGYISYTSQ